MFRRLKSRYTSHCLALVRTSYAYGHGDTCPIDQTPSQSFNIDPNSGRVMSEILSIIRTQDAQQQAHLLSGLNDFKSEFLPPDVTDEQAVKYMCPRLTQLPSQLADWQVNIQMMREAEKTAADKAAADAAVDVFGAAVDDPKKSPVDDPKKSPVNGSNE